MLARVVVRSQAARHCTLSSFFLRAAAEDHELYAEATPPARKSKNPASQRPKARARPASAYAGTYTPATEPAQPSRPASARSSVSRNRSPSPRCTAADRDEQRLRSVPVLEWTSSDVGAWIVSIGMGQYKKHFVHNAVDGRLLLELDLELLRSELRVGPLGHRSTILAALQEIAPQGADRPRSSLPRSGARAGALPSSALFAALALPWLGAVHYVHRPCVTKRAR